MVCVGGKYQLLGKLGNGATSSVYLAVDNVLHKQWAIKEIVCENLDENKKALILQSLRAEVEVLNHCNHPYIPRIVDFFEENGRAYTVRDYIEGYDLKTLIENAGVINPIQACVLGICLCDLLQYLHSLHPAIIYCDLKPSNIVIDFDSNVHLIDFGSALELKNKDGVLEQKSRFKQNARFATHGFAAPELFDANSPIGVFTDVYAIGATLFYALMGEYPSDEDLDQDELSSSEDEEYDFTEFDSNRVDCVRNLVKAIMRALSRNPLDRYEDCEEFAQEIKSCLDDLEYDLKSKLSNNQTSRLALNANYKRSGGKQSGMQGRGVQASRQLSLDRSLDSKNRNRGNSRENGRKASHKYGHKRNNGHGHEVSSYYRQKNLVKIFCCALCAILGCVVLVFAIKSLVNSGHKASNYSYSANNSAISNNKNASEKISQSQEYKQYMVKAANTKDSKSLIKYVNKAMDLQVKLFNANVQPMSIQPALRLLVNQIEDFRWTANERDDFTEFINKYKSDFKKSEDWYELCLSIGKAHWYYGFKDNEDASSTNRKERIEQSEEWFKEALKGVKEKDYELALLYSSLGSKYLEFASYSEGKLRPNSGEYVNKLRTFIENAKNNKNEIVKIDASEMVFESLNAWSGWFCSDGVSQDVVEKLFDDALDIARSLKSQNKNVDNRVKSIMSKADTLIDSIENIFDNGDV